ncbi:MAG: hypothetical protein H0T92_05820 [Pyrinomonadaceae bacterium]|nr:hypothetical protein [Pyrinomonadaceae bacterium]
MLLSRRNTLLFRPMTEGLSTPTCTEKATGGACWLTEVGSTRRVGRSRRGHGASFGGGAAADASVEAEPGEIDRLVLLADSPIDKPEQIKGRKLFILSRDDFSGDDKKPRLPQIRDQYERASGPKELLILEGSAHAQFIFATEQGERLMREILRFLSEP